MGNLFPRCWLHFWAKHFGDIQPFQWTHSHFQCPSTCHGDISATNIASIANTTTTIATTRTASSLKTSQSSSITTLLETTTEVAEKAAQEGQESDNAPIIIISVAVVFVVVCGVGLVCGCMLERKRSKEKMAIFKQMQKEERRKARKKKIKKKIKKKAKRAKQSKDKLAQSMKNMKKSDGVRKALEEYLAGQTQTMTTVEDSERVVEMPSDSDSHATTKSSKSDATRKASNEGSGTPTLPAPRDLGQMPMENVQENSDSNKPG